MLIDLVMVKNILHIHGKNFITKEKFGYPPAPLYPYIPPPLFSWNFSLKSSDQRQNMKLLKYPFFDGFLEFKSKKKGSSAAPLSLHYNSADFSCLFTHYYSADFSCLFTHYSAVAVIFFVWVQCCCVSEYYFCVCIKK